jgi:hypothetical protein
MYFFIELSPVEMRLPDIGRQEPSVSSLADRRPLGAQKMSDIPSVDCQSPV